MSSAPNCRASCSSTSSSTSNSANDWQSQFDRHDRLRHGRRAARQVERQRRPRPAAELRPQARRRRLVGRPRQPQHHHRRHQRGRHAGGARRRRRPSRRYLRGARRQGDGDRAAAGRRPDVRQARACRRRGSRGAEGGVGEVRLHPALHGLQPDPAVGHPGHPHHRQGHGPGAGNDAGAAVRSGRASP